MPGVHARDEIVKVTKRLNSAFAERGDVAGAQAQSCHCDLRESVGGNSASVDASGASRARALIDSALIARGLMPNLVTANTLIKAYRNAKQPEGAEVSAHDARVGCVPWVGWARALQPEMMARPAGVAMLHNQIGTSLTYMHLFLLVHHSSSLSP
eukprot:6176188-Pleurochrysis_carterae.AAC.3